MDWPPSSPLLYKGYARGAAEHDKGDRMDKKVIRVAHGR